mgnify:CR=1 FL=1
MVTVLSKDMEYGVDISFEFLGRVPSLSQNLNESGLICRTSRRVAEMTILDIRFELPQNNNSVVSERWVECSGVVIACEKKGADSSTLPYELAIFFDRMSEKHRNILAHYVAEKS